MKMPSVMKAEHKFSQAPQATIERSAFDRSHSHKLTFDAGYLIPILVDEILPGDTIHLNTSGFCRLTTPLKPLMDNLYLDTFFFFVPTRLVWANWQRFNGEQPNPGDSTVFTIPQDWTTTGLNLGCVEDFMGIPTGVNLGTTTKWNALFARAYFRIWNEWFRDQNLINRLSIGDATGDTGSDITTGHSIQRRGKRHDYFTSCLPWPQKGTGVTISLGTTAPIIPVAPGASEEIKFRNSTTGRTRFESGSTGGNPIAVQGGVTAGSFTQGDPMYWDQSGLNVDLANATGPTINSLRQAFQIQKMLERDARGGSRYIEIIKSHFGVTSPDARLQRPEYLGGGSSPIIISPIAQNTDVQRKDDGTAKTGSTPLANLSAIGTSSFQGHGCVKSFTEHGILIGIASVRADLTYQQGIERMWSRSTRYDYYWPALAHLGEQAVYNREIYAQGTSADNDVFGYQERYAEYRYKPSRISGKYRSVAAGTLDIWHLSQKFTVLPTLNQTFIEENPPMTRVMAVAGEPHLYADFWFNYRMARPMPVYGVPGLIDHF